MSGSKSGSQWTARPSARSSEAEGAAGSSGIGTGGKGGVGREEVEGGSGGVAGEREGSGAGGKGTREGERCGEVEGEGSSRRGERRRRERGGAASESSSSWRSPARRVELLEDMAARATREAARRERRGRSRSELVSPESAVKAAEGESRVGDVGGTDPKPTR